MREVLDTRFFLAHFASDPDTVERTREKLRLLRRTRAGVIPTVVLAETYEQVCRRAGRREAEEKVGAILAWGLPLEPLTAALAKDAGALRCAHPRVPLADAIVAVTAKNLDGRVVSDAPHYRELRVRAIWI